jgi:ribosomal RNA-processing protein 8
VMTLSLPATWHMGVLLIAEVKSRFDAAKGGADSADFVKALKGLGFSLISQDLDNKMFVMFYLQKQVHHFSLG